MAAHHRSGGGAPLPTQKRPALHERLMWICVPVGIVAVVTMLLLFGWSIWTALLLIVLLACPAVMLWAVYSTRGDAGDRPSDRDHGRP